jgi:hypothetical protein
LQAKIVQQAPAENHRAGKTIEIFFSSKPYNFLIGLFAKSNLPSPCEAIRLEQQTWPERNIADVGNACFHDCRLPGL